MNTLIIPCAGLSTRFPGVRPKYLLTHPDGKLMVQKSIEGFDLSYDRLIITVLREHCDKWSSDVILKQIFPQADICILEEPTSCQAETIFKTVSNLSVLGRFISKDCDDYVKVKIPKMGNFLVGLDLRTRPDVSDVAGKSFILLNDKNMVIDILEKDVSSNFIGVGVYGFESGIEFMKAYKEINGEIYLSHIVSYMMAQGTSFFYREAFDYDDYGRLELWQHEREKHSTYFIDIDGVIFKNRGQWGPENWESKFEPLWNNIEAIKKLIDNGAQIMFCTARIEDRRDETLAILLRVGLKPDQLIMGCYHTKRIIINDYSNTNPYPSCEAINIPRDDDNLEEFLCTR